MISAHDVVSMRHPVKHCVIGAATAADAALARFGAGSSSGVRSRPERCTCSPAGKRGPGPVHEAGLDCRKPSLRDGVQQARARALGMLRQVLTVPLVLP